MLELLKDAMLDPKFHKALTQKIVLAVAVAAVSAVAEQTIPIMVQKVKTSIDQAKANADLIKESMVE